MRKDFLPAYAFPIKFGPRTWVGQGGRYGRREERRQGTSDDLAMLFIASLIDALDASIVNVALRTRDREGPPEVHGLQPPGLQFGDPEHSLRREALNKRGSPPHLSFSILHIIREYEVFSEVIPEHRHNSIISVKNKLTYSETSLNGIIWHVAVTSSRPLILNLPEGIPTATCIYRRIWGTVPCPCP